MRNTFYMYKNLWISSGDKFIKIINSQTDRIYISSSCVIIPLTRTSFYLELLSISYTVRALLFGVNTLEILLFNFLMPMKKMFFYGLKKKDKKRRNIALKCANAPQMNHSEQIGWDGWKCYTHISVSLSLLCILPHIIPVKDPSWSGGAAAAHATRLGRFYTSFEKFNRIDRHTRRRGVIESSE